jgi:hypothetical protein
MSDLLEDDLREAFADRAARITPEASARLRAVDYHPRSGRLSSRRARSAVGALGLSGAAAVAGAIVLLGSNAAPAFAGWTSSPTTPRPGQIAAAQQCATGSGTPVLTDTRGPYTASIYADGATCLQGNGIEISDGGGGNATADTPAGTIELNGAGESDSDGHALTMVDGRIGSGVTGVTITRSDGSSVQATVKNGWYLAWWPGSEHAVTAHVASASGTGSQSFPSGPQQPAPACPTGSQCSSGYGFGTGSAHRAGQSSVRITGGSAGGH